MGGEFAVGSVWRCVCIEDSKMAKWGPLAEDPIIQNVDTGLESERS